MTALDQMPGAAISRRLLAEQAQTDVPESPFPDEPPDEPGEPDTGRASILERYTPIHWPDLWADTTDDGPDWLVPDVLERGRSHALVGAAKSGKSLLTLDMVCGLVTGRSLLGRPSPHEQPVRVLYVDLENAKADIRERLDSYGVGPEDLAALAYYSFPSLPALDSPAGGRDLLALAERHDAELVIIDTVARVVVGPENDADTFRALYRHALAPLKAQARAALRLDHLGKDSTAGARGSSAKADDVDTIWHLLDHGEGRIALRLDRQRSGHHPETIDLIRRTEETGRLRHVRHEPAGDPRVAGLVADLDRLDVAPAAGRRAARKALTDAGIKVGNDLIDRAQQARQNYDQVCPAQINNSELFEIIGAVPDISGTNENRPSSQRARHTPGTSGTGAVVPKAECAAPTPCLIRGTGEGTPPAPGPDIQADTPQICPRCRLPAERFVPPDGLCERCAYPAGGAPGEATEEDQ